MSTEKPAGFVISQSKIALLLSILTLFGVFYQGAAFIQSTQFRIESLEKSQTQVVDQLGRLATSISDLNMTLREVQVRQENK